ncbi:MAG: aspartyl protease family protein [Bacteroidales bacterium]|jgi:hypothetical protein|nr:aspartyl protease family protein [Bacteroidales bacterium]
MMRRYSKTFYKFLLLFFCISQGFQAHSQFIGYRIDSSETKSVFPFELINNLVIVPVLLNDSVWMKFLLDTGVRTTLLTEGNEHHLEVTYNRPVKISGLGASGEIEAFVASNVKLQLPGITGRGQTLIVLGEDYLNLQSHIGQEVHGILGYDFFSHFVVKIDYSSKIITVYESETYKPPSRYSIFPIKLVKGRPYLNAAIIQSDGSKISGSFLIDTGASHSLLLEPDSINNIRLPSKTLPAILGWGISGAIDGKIGRIKLFSLGQFNFKNVVSSYGASLRTAEQLIPDRIGSIGGEVLSRFTLILDYKSEKLYLKKNHNYHRNFSHNKSGLNLVAEGKEFKTFSVIHVLEGSPAAKAGILQGDIVVAINGKGAAQLSLEEVQGIFHSKSAQMVEIIILRDEQYLSYSFWLKNLI